MFKILGVILRTDFDTKMQNLRFFFSGKGKCHLICFSRNSLFCRVENSGDSVPKRKDTAASSLQKTMTLGHKVKLGRRKNGMIQFKNFEMAKGGKEKFIIVNARNKCVETLIS